MLLPDAMKWNDDKPGCEYLIPELAEREARIRRAFLPSGMEYDSREYWQYLRLQNEAERTRESLQMTQLMFEEVQAEIKTEHPDRSERLLKIEFVARMYGPTLAEHFRRHVKEKGIYVHSH